MADNILDITILSPFQFVQRGYENPAQYNTKYKENFLYPDTIQYWDEKIPYLQPWQQVDILPFQILSNYGPHELQLFTCGGEFVTSFSLTYKPSSIEITGQKVYEANVALNIFPEGVYRFVIDSGGGAAIHDGNLFSLMAKHESTVLLETTNKENDFDAVFETGYVAKLRVYGKVGLYTPGSNRVLFIDQPNNITQLKGRVFSTESLIIGDQYGVPEYIIEIINLHFCCSNVLIDGKQYVGNDGARFEATREDFVPMAGWLFELRDAKARTRRRFIATGLIASPMSVVFNIQNKGFGPITGPASSNVIQITNLE